MLEYRRYRDAAAHLSELFAEGRRYLYRSAPLPPELRRVALDAARPAYDPDAARRRDRRPAARAAGPDTSHIRPDRLARAAPAACCASCSRRAGRFDFDEAFGDEDQLTQAVTLFALLEMHKRGEATWEQDEVFGPIRSRRRQGLGDGETCRSSGSSRRCCSSRRSRSRPRSSPRPARRARPRSTARSTCSARRSPRASRRRPARGRRAATRSPPHPDAEDAARRLLAKPRTPPLTQAQAETLAIVAYLQPVSRPEIARIRGVSSESAVATLTERGLIEESGRSRFGAVVYRTTPLFERLFGLAGLDALPDPAQLRPDARGRARAARAPAEGRRAARRATVDAR